MSIFPGQAPSSPAPAPLPTLTPSSMAPSHSDLVNIQGNILGGFKKDFQNFLFLRFASASSARAWLLAVVPDLASSAEVIAFNKLHKASRAKHGREGFVKSAWVNVAFTYEGLRALGAPGTEAFPADFKEGMRARAGLLGDVGESAPERWIPPFQGRDPHALVLLAADSEDDLGALTVAHTATAAAHGVHVTWLQQGRVRRDLPGHEHFGFKDGVSQPGLRGIDPPDDLTNPDQGHAGQHLLWPGEFVLGYATQTGEAEERPRGELGPSRAPGPVSRSGPAWTRNGSYLVYRRLRQDVRGFKKFVAETAKRTGEDDELTSARLMGRFPDGAPLEPLRSAGFPSPLLGSPAASRRCILDEENVNNFDYGSDPRGHFVPLASHIRKAYPRDDEADRDGAAPPRAEKRRLLRRGIPFGDTYSPLEPQGKAFPADRGLNFLAYQRSIEEQFEAVQQALFGGDPIAGGGPEARTSGCPAGHHFTMTAKSGKEFQLDLVKRWVSTTGGAYFFQPAIDVLERWARAPSEPGPVAGSRATASAWP